MNIELLKLTVMVTTNDITAAEKYIKTMDRKVILACLSEVNELRIGAEIQRYEQQPAGYESQIEKYILALEIVEQVIMSVITGLLGVEDDELF